MAEKKREGREQCSCFARQPPHRLKFRTIRPLSLLLCNLQYYFFYSQIMELVFIMRQLIKQTTVCIVSYRLNMTW